MNLGNVVCHLISTLNVVYVLITHVLLCMGAMFLATLNCSYSFFLFLPFVLYKARDIDRQLITVLCKVILLSNELFVQLRRGFAFQSNLPDFSKMFSMWLISSA